MTNKEGLSHKQGTPRRRSIGGLLSLSLVLMLLSQCSSQKFVRDYDKEGQISQIRYLEKGLLKYTVSFDYDLQKRIITIRKIRSREETPAKIVQIRFDPQNRVRMLSHDDVIGAGENPVKDTWVESYFFNRTGVLYKIETSYKSSHSISLNKSALVTSRFYYRSGLLTLIKINGGTFKKELKPHYSKREIQDITYKYFAVERKKKGFELKKHLQIFYEKGKAVRFKDLSGGPMVESLPEVRRILQEEAIDSALSKSSWVSHYKAMLNHIEQQLLSGQ